MSRGVLVTSQNPQLVTPTSTSYYGVGQYQSGQQQHGQAWPGVVDSPYYTSNGATSSMNNPQASPSDQSPYTSQTPFSAYNSYTNTFHYDAPSYGRSDAYQQHESPAQEPQETPHASNRKRNRMAHGSSDVEPLTDVEDMIAQLKADIDASFTNEVARCTSSEYTLGGNALVPLMRPSFGPYSEGGHQDLPDEFKRNQLENGGTEAGAGQVRDEDESQLESPSQPQNNPGEATQSTQERNHSSAQEGETEITHSPAQSSPSAPSSTTDPFKTCPNALVSTILGISSEKIRSIVQRAASRGLLERIGAHDGFRYQFNNAWSSRVDDNSLRFSYICRDSLQNKDRMAHVPSIAPLRKIKQSYDCKGSVSVKFSTTAGVIIVQYKHTAIHPKPAHNRPRETNRPSVPRGTTRPRARGAGPGRPLGSGRMRGSKRKHGDDAPLPEFMAQSPVVPFTPAQFPQQQIREQSLFELLQQSAIETAAKGGTGQLGSTEMPWWGSS